MSYTHLTSEERFSLELLLHAELSYRDIAQCLGRHHTTISREVRRNRSSSGAYRNRSAQRLALRRRTQARHHRRQTHAPLVDYVAEKLSDDWSPEQICGRLRRDFPHDKQMRCSPETIYRWAYLDAQQGGQAYGHLRHHHRRRRRQKRMGQGCRFLPGRIGIAERPAIVGQRSRFGDWEADLMLGAPGKGAMTSCLERKSRYILGTGVPDKSADAFKAAIEEVMVDVPQALRCTLTVDNGKEMAKFKALEEATGFQIYFADPYAPWQRGANENGNGLLRQYFPKGCNFRKVSDNQIRRAIQRLNHRPRKCLNYRTPHEVFRQAIGGALAN